METVIETVQFRLTNGETEQDFIAAAEQSQNFVKQQPGFLYRSLSHEAASNTWTDIIYWRSQADATNASKLFTQCEDCKPLMNLIEPESVEMKHHSVKMCSELED